MDRCVAAQASVLGNRTPNSASQTFITTAPRLGSQIVTASRASVRGDIEVLLQSDPTWGVGLTAEVSGLLPELDGWSRPAGPWPEIAVGRAMFAVAATGSPVIAEADHRDRLMSLLCLRHIVLLSARSILDTLDDTVPVLRAWVGEGIGNYVTFVSNPSRTQVKHTAEILAGRVRILHDA